MSYRIMSVFIPVLIFFMVVPAGAAEKLDDPYEILNRQIEASGGLERLKAEKSQYIEAELSVAGMTGTLKAWSARPDLSRAEIDLGILKITQGDNGKFSWVLDSNGKLQKTSKLDQAAQDRKKVKKLMSEFKHIDPESEIFTVTLEGTEEVEGKKCYVIKITNSINDDYYTSYINTSDFMTEKAVSIQGKNSSDSYFGDYRKVEGLKVAFWTKEVSHQTGQPHEISINKYVSNPEIDPGLFDPPEEKGKDFRFITGNSSENVPFRLIGNHIYIPVTVNCKERLWVLDTGAGMSVIEKSFADELGLKGEGDMKGVGAGGTVDIQLTTLPSFSIEGIEFDPQTAAIIDMNDLTRILGVDIAGILGFDFLSRFVTRVDYANELLSFYDPETFEYSGDGRELDVHMQNSVFMVEATLDGEHTGTWLFDLGAGSASLDGAYAYEQGYRDKKGVESLGHGAANAFTNKGILCRSLELGGYKVDNTFLSFPVNEADTVFNADEIGGLGNSLFRNFVVYVDYADERVILEKGAAFNKSFPLDRSGLKLTRGDNEELVALFISPDTPAEKAGFRAGDTIRSINGIAVEHFDGLLAVREMLKDKPGTEYVFVIDREGQEKELKLKLKDLY